jgi:rubrerythrin
MAGCMKVADAVKWSKDREISEILDLMMSLEANTFDLYLKLGRQVKSEQARSVFLALSEKETHHLDTLASAFEKTI